MATTVSGEVDLFGHDGQAKQYVAFRPRYTKEIVDEVMSRVQGKDLYLDVACGSGQLTDLIAPLFERTIAIDQSLEQLGQITCPQARIEYKAGSAFELPVESNSVDLLTVAQALHWLIPYEKFFAEVDRVLKPGGVFVTIGYGFSQPVDAEIRAVGNKFYYDVLGSNKLPGEAGSWWDTNRITIDSHYADIPFPHPQSVVRKYLPSTVTLSVSHYCNYLRTLSAYRTLLRSKGLQNEDPMVEIQAEMEAIVRNRCYQKGQNDASNESLMIQVEYPFFTVSFMKPL